VGFRTGRVRVAQLRRRFDAREVLALQAWLLAPRSNPPHAQRPSRDHRQRERRAKDLSSAFAARTVDLDQSIAHDRILRYSVNP
jgi:hypothetical protein